MDGRRDEGSRERREGIGDERAGDLTVDDRRNEGEGGEREAEGESGDEVGKTGQDRSISDANIQEITEVPCSSSAQATDTPSIIHLGDAQPHKQVCAILSVPVER